VGKGEGKICSVANGNGGICETEKKSEITEVSKAEGAEIAEPIVGKSPRGSRLNGTDRPTKDEKGIAQRESKREACPCHRKYTKKTNTRNRIAREGKLWQFSLGIVRERPSRGVRVDQRSQPHFKSNALASAGMYGTGYSSGPGEGLKWGVVRVL